jgi:hypothetical protein
MDATRIERDYRDICVTVSDTEQIQFAYDYAKQTRLRMLVKSSWTLHKRKGWILESVYVFENYDDYWHDITNHIEKYPYSETMCNFN